MEFEGSCPQDTVGLVVLKGLSLSASTRENLDVQCMLTDTVHALIRTFFVARLMTAVLGDIYPSHFVLFLCSSSDGKCTLLGTSTTRPGLLYNSMPTKDNND
ncbi:hypothetical protein NC653_028587 [Populus alba x Populus x berolinensis]|uniref:Uncharacterized protein n=2 Tax=Populus alba x Populus x berolinensis TaxID=444605 RepID=A0AAD6Q4A2_9ROSI|nr:hypothetical protein NC653_028587 [Populus alba x Populus x berolinensis]